MRMAWLAVASVATALAAGCGSDNGADGSAAERPAEPTKPAAVDVDKDPGAITCSDLEDKEASARMSRTATFTLADEVLAEQPKLSRKTNRNLLAQQIFAGMVEVCEEEGASFKPAEPAVERAVTGL